MTKIRISPLVFIFAAVMLYLGKGFELVSYFIAVIMHEMVHAEVAKRRGYVLRHIKIMPYGAALSGEFDGINCRDELIIAMAGPLGNVFVAILFTAVWWLVPSTYFFTETFVLSNVFTALTNILPVFPLDGGRVLMALMSRKLPRQKAYKLVRAFGFGAFVLFCALFLFSLLRGVNFSFALMAFFVLTGTVFPDKNSKYQRLYSMAYRSEKLRHGLVVREVMVADSLTLYQLGKMLNGNYYYRFCIVDEKLRVKAVLTETDLEKCLTAYPHETPLRELPQSVFAN